MLHSEEINLVWQNARRPRIPNDWPNSERLFPHIEALYAMNIEYNKKWSASIVPAILALNSHSTISLGGTTSFKDSVNSHLGTF